MRLSQCEESARVVKTSNTNTGHAKRHTHTHHQHGDFSSPNRHRIAGLGCCAFLAAPGAAPLGLGGAPGIARRQQVANGKTYTSTHKTPTTHHVTQHVANQNLHTVSDEHITIREGILNSSHPPKTVQKKPTQQSGTKRKAFILFCASCKSGSGTSSHTRVDRDPNFVL